MPTTAESLAEALAHLQAGRLPLAEQTYRAVLDMEPNQPDALHLLGVIQHRLGRNEAAIDLIQRAIAVRDDQPYYHNNLGEACRALRRTAEAIACYRRAIQLKPVFAGFHYNLGNALKDADKLPEAAACYRRSLELAPDDAPTLNNLGNTYKALGQVNEAAACFERAIQLRPDYAEAHNNLGNVLKEQQQLARALACFRRAVELSPRQAAFHGNLGGALHALGHRDDALTAFRQALELQPDFAEGYYGLGHAMHEEGQFTQAVEYYQQAVKLKPSYCEALNNLANAWKDQGRLTEALACFDRALELKPDDLTALSNRLYALQYREGITLAELAAAHQVYETRHAARHRGAWKRHDNLRDSDRPLRLGFVSPDFSNHPVAFFLIRVLENLDRQSCEIVCYHDRWSTDEWSTRFRAAATLWRPIAGQTDEQVAGQVRQDQVDILFDLTGHTAHNRLLVFARKPAPLQVSWIGYEGTTGLSAIDFILADRHVIPAGSEQHYRERVLRMPHGYLCYDPPAAAPPVGPLPAIASGRVTFGCFNNLAKITPQVVAAWAKILLELPQSRLLLQYKGLGDEIARNRFTAMFAEQGIDARQLDLRAPTPFLDYLATYGQVDLALDPFPFTGSTVTCQALWMGVPVITCPGETLASRHSLSHLSTIGMTETIAQDLDDYVAIAVRMAHDLPRLDQLRASLRKRMSDSPLCDGKQFAKDLMALLRASWRQWLRQESA